MNFFYKLLSTFPFLSVFSLASRAYFIQRDEDNSDPDPELKMVAMRVFPCILIVVVHSLAVWTCIAGLLGEFVVPSIFMYFCAAYSPFILANAHPNKGNLCFATLLVLLFTFVVTLCFILPTELSIPLVVVVILYLLAFFVAHVATALTPCPSVHLVLRQFYSKKETNLRQILSSNKTVLTSLWLTCVVGTGPFTFLLSSLISLLYKNLLFLFAVACGMWQVACQ